ncbi:MAG: DegT/DnrJ/EryC1/StrS family aminotransferase, partial [Nitrospira sp.]|nr:DegT/DnrJ/EryC1/StrS family aminotransferase [Nitrospira sp.]
YHIYNQFILRVPNRDGLRTFLSEKGIGTEIYYPMPLHLQECYKDLGYREGTLPVAEAACKETVGLPVFPELTQQQQEYVVETIKQFYQNRT